MTNCELSKQLRLELNALEWAERELSPFDSSFEKDAQVIMDKISSTWDDIENIPWTEDEINADEARYDVSVSLNLDFGPRENIMLRGANNHKSPPASISISETDLADKRSDLFYEITSTGSGAGFSLHDLCEELDDEQKDNIIAMMMVGNDDAKEYANQQLLAAFVSLMGDDALEAYIINEKED